MAAQQPSREEQRAFAEQIAMLGAYVERCSEGYKPLEKYLESLYSELDGLLDVPLDEKEAGNIRKAHSDYKASLKSARMEIAKYSDLDKLVKKVLSGSITSEEEAKISIESIQTTYNAVVGGAAALYQLIDPKIDASKLINAVYLKLAKYKKLDIRHVFETGLEILKTYYIPKEIAEKLGHAAAKAGHEVPEEQEALPQAA